MVYVSALPELLVVAMQKLWTCTFSYFVDKRLLIVTVHNRYSMSVCEMFVENIAEIRLQE